MNLVHEYLVGQLHDGPYSMHDSALTDASGRRRRR